MERSYCLVSSMIRSTNFPSLKFLQMRRLSSISTCLDSVSTYDLALVTDDSPDGHPFEVSTDGVHLTLVNGDTSVLNKRLFVVPELRRAIPVGVIGDLCCN